MKLSSLHEGDIGLITVGKKSLHFIVTNRWAEDRSSGGTEITFEDGEHQTYWWDHEDPEVRRLGRGTLKTTIIHKEDV